MRLANVRGKAILVRSKSTGVDVASASDGRFADFAGIYEDWAAFREWADSADLSASPVVSFDRGELGSPSPTPRQIFAVGLNYAEHAAESGFEIPDGLPPVFTKYVSSLTGPDTTVTLPAGGRTDWEVELVVVIGAVAHDVVAEDAWGHVAGLTIAQDISERTTQFAGPAPQFSLGKSFAGFTPVGPWLVTTDELADPMDLELAAKLNDEVVQRARTNTLLIPVPDLIERLSAIVTLLPGDLILTGTPSGVGVGRNPQVFLKPGDELVSWVEGIGDLHQTFTN